MPNPRLPGALARGALVAVPSAVSGFINMSIMTWMRSEGTMHISPSSWNAASSGSGALSRFHSNKLEQQLRKTGRLRDHGIVICGKK